MSRVPLLFLSAAKTGLSFVNLYLAKLTEKVDLSNTIETNFFDFLRCKNLSV